MRDVLVTLIYISYSLADTSSFLFTFSDISQQKHAFLNLCYSYSHTPLAPAPGAVSVPQNAPSSWLRQPDEVTPGALQEPRNKSGLLTPPCRKVHYISLTHTHATHTYAKTCTQHQARLFTSPPKFSHKSF